MSALSSSPSPSPSSSTTTTTTMSSCFCILSLISISLLVSASVSASASISISGGSSILVTAFSTRTTTSYNNKNNKNNKNRQQQQQQQYRRSFSNDNNNGSSQQFLSSISSSSSPSALTLAACDISSAMELPVVNELVSSYGYCLKNHFFPTQSITNAVLTMVGDGFAQSKENSDNNSNSQEQEQEQQQQQNQESVYDPKRGMTYFFKGLGSGILWAIWFEQADVLSKELTQSTLSHYHIPSLPSQQQHIETALQTIISILMEQFLICPILFATWDIPITSIMSGTDVKQIPKQIDDKLIPLLTANAKVWTLVNVITYNIPLQYRLLFTSGASIVSETINSGITSKQGIEVTPVPVVPQQQTIQIINNKRNLGETTIDRTTPVLATATIAATTVGGGGGRMKLRNTNSTFVAL
ncbi:hypothetical protein FRACYDRAFT_239531 [Fragilariopsis cylindrus CCMP1102]|uniref:Uncharacterized protein n=1 Tax=Fragilariopsis cylindrus CCMP1102 TaxID=635003 RepID=A0A1E7FFW5_9STRA|nr:hypothetical protein FRACYDRAFT_239531 [Fragilariopsis cylindrus CCMP1102]|eukprot:OEU16935.1 hypothetical protein FRACYDRAFT_239531 [Fragilariopsis cylindrus CCMP1102]